MARLVDSGDVAGPSGSLSSVIQKKKPYSGQSSAISVKSAAVSRVVAGQSRWLKSLILRLKGSSRKVLAVAQVKVLPRLRERRTPRKVMMMMILM